MQEVTCEEIDAVRALWLLEPWGDRRDDMRMRRSTHLLAAASGVDLPNEACDYLTDLERIVEEKMERDKRTQMLGSAAPSPACQLFNQMLACSG